MDPPDPSDAVRNYYDSFGEKEWDRLTINPRSRVSLEIHRRFLTRHIRPESRVLEIGAGPGRFTIELAKLGASVVVTDISPVQLRLNAQHVGETDFEQAVEHRELVDVCDTSTYLDDEFDAIVAYGGPLSYAFERVDVAMRGLFRITKPGGPVIASVMSLLGTWRYFLSSVIEEVAVLGEEATDTMLRTGDLRHIASGPESHICQMFRWRDLEDLVRRAEGRMIDGSASNFASLSDSDALLQIERDPDRWSLFLDREIEACQQIGTRDAGTHILFAAIGRA